MILPWSIASLFWSSILTRPSCRCLHGEKCWPSTSEFSRLASTLSRPLIHPVPPEAACYPASSPAGNCTAVLQGAFDGNWRSDQSGSMQSPNFETFIFGNGTVNACYLNTTLGVPCGQGSVPVIGVDAHSVQDVQAAVKFASKHNLRLVIKNTGHDYLGRSTARGSFLLWTHHLKNITYNAAFVPDGASISETYNAITLGSGVQWHEAYDAIQAQGRFVVGGLSIGASVGAAGGWVLGGGHSAFSPQHGLGVDNVVQFTVVTSDGSYLAVNSHRHPDLFWALRGGGGGTYGVIISATYRTYPSVPLTGAFFVANLTNPKVASRVITEFVRLQPSISDAGWGGYSFIFPNSLIFAYVAPNVSWAEANITMNPFFAFARNATSDGPAIVSLTAPFDSFYSWYKLLFFTGEQVGSNVEIGSRLFPRDLVENDYAEVTETLMDVGGAVIWHLVAGGAVSKVDPESTGLNPAWRKALAHVVFAREWPEGAPVAVIDKARDEIRANLKKFEQLAPGSAAYFNEASLYEENPEHTFFGTHYGKLKAIKDIYDPHSLFIVAEGVGSVEWDSSLNCRR